MKRLGKVLIALLMVSSLVACSFGNTGTGENENEDNGNEILDIISDKIEQASIPKYTFEYVKGDTIELEVGTTIDENNIDEYILAHDYENITIDDSKIGNFFLSNNVDDYDGSRKHYFEISKYFPDTDSTQKLKLYVIWVDTQAPTCDKTDVYWYTYRLVDGKTDEIEFNEPEAYGWLPYSIYEYEFLGLKDNGPQIIPDEVFVNGRSVMYNDNEFYTMVYIKDRTTNLVDYALFPQGGEEDYYMVVTPGDYELQLNVRDVGNNKASFKVTLHVVEDLSPEDKEILNANGISTDTIESKIAELHNKYEINVQQYKAGAYWQYSFEN